MSMPSDLHAGCSRNATGSLNLSAAASGKPRPPGKTAGIDLPGDRRPAIRMNGDCVLRSGADFGDPTDSTTRGCRVHESGPLRTSIATAHRPMSSPPSVGNGLDSRP